MTKFESTGVNLQCSSLSMEESNKNFSNSCRICCSIGVNIKCKGCLISAAHDSMVAALNDISNSKFVHHVCCDKHCTTQSDFDITKCPNCSIAKPVYLEPGCMLLSSQITDVSDVASTCL